LPVLFLAGILALTIILQSAAPVFDLSFDTDYNIDWNDSDSSESDIVDVEENEHKKDFNPLLHFYCQSCTYGLTNACYRLHKHSNIQLDINLPPPEQFCI
jgi:hypothetical protein